MLLREETKCFAFLAGHESFAAAEGAIGIAKSANKVRKEPLRVILNGLGKDAAQIISRVNGFTYMQTASVPAHGEKMGFSGMGNNLMVGATVAVAAAVEEAMKPANNQE